MLYYLHLFSAHWGALNVFKYVTLRCLGAAATAFVISLLAGPWVIRRLRALKLGQPLRTQKEVHRLADLHEGKQGTPTMGGVLILGAVTISTLLWCLPTVKLVWIVLGALLFLGWMGAVDDHAKIRLKQSKGMTARKKLAGQFLVAVAVTFFLVWGPSPTPAARELYIPFFKLPAVLDLGIFAVLFFALVIVGTSNAVNLTDGLDGLAIGCTVTVALGYAIFAYVAGNVKIAEYLHLPYVAGAGELAVFCSALMGAGLGFLWYNSHPAQVFMGDTGSLALGGALGVVAICVHQELALVIAGGVFVVEALSVMLQVASFKLTGKRPLAMAPLHHHFELKGWSETKVTVRFWILSLVCVLLALATLKLR